MLSRCMRKSLYFLAICLPFFLVATRIWEPQCIMMPAPMNGFAGYIEMFLPALMLIPLSLLLHDPFEIELGLVSGVRTSRLFFSKLLPLVVYGAVSVLAMILLVRDEPFVETDQMRALITISVPDNYKLLLAISVVVTLLFFASVVVFFRVLTRNCYAPVGMGLFIYLFFEAMNKDIRMLKTGLEYAIVDPFISTYFIGNGVARKEGLGKIWTHNRILFFFLSLVLFGAAYIMLRREKLHENLGD